MSSALIASQAKLGVETDDHKSAFGKWLYGKERSHIEKQYPSLIKLLKEIEDPHKKLHQSAIEIEKLLQAGDPDEAEVQFANRTQSPARLPERQHQLLRIGPICC